MELELICESPKGMAYGEITDKHTQLLEQQIVEKPNLWLWSHKKWKREIPTNRNELMQKHKEQFQAKFKAE
jgi:KDO2-lipid IV(A) lauroyltransferase